MGRPADLLATLDPLNVEAAGEMLNWWMAGVEAVEPGRLVRRALSDTSCEVASITDTAESVVVLAVGKAATAMAQGADDALGGRIACGLVITDASRPCPAWAEVVVGGHPVPNEASATAATAAMRLVDGVAPNQLLLALVSGGGSALMEIPHPALALTDVQEVVDQLIRSSAPIEIINRIRGRLSQVKAGRLAARCAGTVATLALSDVVGSDPARIASGPTVAPQTSIESIRDSFNTYGIVGPEAKRVFGFDRDADETTLAVGRFPVSIVGTGRTAGNAAVEAIRRSGAEVGYVSDRLEGDACAAADEALARTPNGEVAVFTGETTVLVSGTGRGGRNQHAALAAALQIAETDIRFLACGTDGIDGPTDASGALVDGRTATDAASARRHLTGCDAYPFLDRARALVRTGPTGTNVGDLWIVDKRQ